MAAPYGPSSLDAAGKDNLGDSSAGVAFEVVDGANGAARIEQMETNAEWTVRPAPRGTLVEFLAVRLLLERFATASLAKEHLGFAGPLQGVRQAALDRPSHRTPTGNTQRAFLFFQLTQVMGILPEELFSLPPKTWGRLADEIDAFSEIQRRRTFHLAYERRYCHQTLDALAVHSRGRTSVGADAGDQTPSFQIVCCIDDREESFRRHLEEVDPRCETLAIAGFYGVAMYYRGAGDAHPRPLCPVVIKPNHYVEEHPVYTFEELHRRRARARQWLGSATHQFHRGSRSLVERTPAGSVPSNLALALLIGAVLIRSGIVPTHCWMTDLFEHASFGRALMFVTPMVGVYAAVRLLLPIAPEWALRSIALISLFTAVYAAGMALVQREARRFFCYLFLSHSSLVLVGLEIATPVGLTGALSLWISVGLALTGFGLTLRSIEARIGRVSLAEFHGLYEHTPALAAFFLITGLASIGFPGTIGFVGAELLVEGAVDEYPLVGLAVVLAAALNGIAVLHAYFRVFTGKRYFPTISLRSRGPERIAVLILAALILGGGIYPQPSLSSRYHAASEIIEARRHLAGPPSDQQALRAPIWFDGSPADERTRGIEIDAQSPHPHTR